MRKVRYGVRLLLTSLSMLLCSLIHFVWEKLLQLTEFLGKIKSIGDDDFEILSLSSWGDLFESGSKAAEMHVSSFSVIIPFSIICGLLGVIYAIIRCTKHDLVVFNAVLVVFGAVISFLGMISFALLAVSGEAVLFALIMLALTLVAVPFLFFVVAIKCCIRKK